MASQQPRRGWSRVIVVCSFSIMMMWFFQITYFPSRGLMPGDRLVVSEQGCEVKPDEHDEPIAEAGMFANSENMQPDTAESIGHRGAVFMDPPNRLYNSNGIAPSKDLYRDYGSGSKSILRPDTSSSTVDSTAEDGRSLSPEFSREELWGCYDYRANRLGASRSPADGETLERLNCTRRAPDAILIGVKKCGTQALTGYLDLHPEIVSSAYPFQKHEQSFADGNFDDVIINSPLSTPSEVTFIDMTDIQDCPESFASLFDLAAGGGHGTKFFLVMVDPVERARSDYIHVKMKANRLANKDRLTRKELPVWDKKLRHKNETNIFFKGYRIADTFEKSALNASGFVDTDNELIRKGIYVNYVEEILNYTSRENLFVLNGETFASEPWTVLNEVERILGIGTFFKRRMFQKKGKFYCPVLEARPDADCLKENNRKKRQIDNVVKRRLGFFYQPLNTELRKILGEDIRFI